MTRAFGHVRDKKCQRREFIQYRIVCVNGDTIDKVDPYAFYSELRPNNASIIASLKFDGWQDQQWMKTRRKGFDSPVNIYEMHVGSWIKDEDMEDFVHYDQIIEELIIHCKQKHYTHVEVMPLNEYPFDGSWDINVPDIFPVLHVMVPMSN